MSTAFLHIDNTPRDYDWGQINGVAQVRGTAPTGKREAELWLGAHHGAPSVIIDPAPWASLESWEQETAARLPFLLKILCAAEPLSLQAHPTPEQALEGFNRENAAGIDLNAAHRNYRDPYSKPEMIVALHDGFEALCGFRPVTEVLSDLEAMSAMLDSHQAATIEKWKDLLMGPDGIRAAFLWLLSDDARIAPLVESVSELSRENDRFAVLARIAAAHPQDPGILGALMLQHLKLHAGEALWLPAGNIHAYLYGSGIELMGPSDNVLRGGLTTKHIDTEQLSLVMDAKAGGDPRLRATELSQSLRIFAPEADFKLYECSSTGSIEVSTAAIALCTAGSFTLSHDGASIQISKGQAVFITSTALDMQGQGQVFIATGA